MNELREQLSALMDGELDKAPARFLLRRLEGDAELAACWSRYQLAAAVMRREAAAVLPLRAGFAAAVCQQLQAEPTRGTGMRVLRWASGGAIAAAVAVFALVANQPAVHAPASGTNLAALPVSAAAVRRDVYMPIAPSFDYAQPASFDSAALIDLPRYDMHAQFDARDRAQARVPYVLLVAPMQSVQPAPRAPAPEPTH